jgi:hypothetical protein
MLHEFLTSAEQSASRYGRFTPGILELDGGWIQRWSLVTVAARRNIPARN